MSALNISDEELDSIFRTLSAVLWIGEIEFDPKGDASAVAQKSFDAIDNIAELLKIERELLMNCFTKRETKVSERSKETITRIHKPEEARYARDAWAKTMYARLFDWIIQKINHSIFPSKAIGSSIGVLDIYGFEVFQTNGFEQFCINYVNEKLQHVFIERTIKLEQEEYHQENIPWTQIDYFNNKIVCDLIESKQNGLISLLNETCLTPKGGDEYFFNLVRDNLSEHPHISSPDVKTHRLQFTVKHYAGDVEYSLHGFVDKNKDLVWKDLMNCGHSSKLEFLRSLFPEKEILELGQKRPVTAGTQFKDQVSHLVETLCKCTPHYIRCVKPNDIKKPVLWSEQRVLHQVKYLGLLENVKVRRAGYAYRQNLVGFLNRYKMVCPETWPNWDAKNAAHGCSVILEYIGVNGDGFKLGKTKIFVQNPRTMIELEVRRADKIKQLTLLISACSKAKAPRVFYHEYKAAKALQTAWRRMKALKFYTEFKAAEVLQSKMKGALFRTTKVQYIACTFLQRSWRYHASRKWGISTRLFLNEEVTPFKDRRKMSADFFPVRCYLPELLKSGAIEELFKPTGDSNILFVQRALKYGTKFKIRERVVIVSNLAVFDCEWFPEKKKERALKLHHRFALHSLTQISLLPKHDNFVVLHMPTQYDLAYSMNYKSEFISILSERYQVLVKKKLNIKVLDTITMVMKDKKHRSLVTGSVQDRMEKGKHDKLETFSWIELDKKNHDIAYVNVLSDPIAPKDSFTCIQLIPASELAKLVKPAIAENHQGIPSDVKSDSEDPVQAPAEVNNTRKVSINSTPSSMPSSEEPSSLVDDQNTKPSTVDDPPQNIPTQITTAEAESN
jgi:myosin-1